MKTELLLMGLAAAVVLSHWFNLLAARWRLPSVLFLLLTGLLVRQAATLSDFTLALPVTMLPLLGTIGLILIVLEGALDLRLDHRHGPLLARTATLSTLSMTLIVGVMGGALHWLLEVDLWLAMLVSTPFAIISSAVAIPSSAILTPEQREFVVYESSISDIVGVMFFNALLVSVTETGSFAANFVLGGTAVLLVGVVMGVAIYALVGHLDGHVKFAPLLFGLLGVYGLAKWMHLSPLLLVLILGLMLNNPALTAKLPMPKSWHSPHYQLELDKLKHLTAEATFVVRTLFFLLLGFSTDMKALTSWQAWLSTLAILGLIFASRWLFLRLTARAYAAEVLVWMAPRGLITVLLYYTLPEAARQVPIPEGTLMLVVLLSCLVMSMGLRRFAGPAPATDKTESGEGPEPLPP